MISETGTFTVDRVLEWMGDLSAEKNVAKHAARRSLVWSACFCHWGSHAILVQPLSTTRELDFGIRIVRIEDVKREWDGRT